MKLKRCVYMHHPHENNPIYFLSLYVKVKLVATPWNTFICVGGLFHSPCEKTFAKRYPVLQLKTPPGLIYFKKQWEMCYFTVWSQVPCWCAFFLMNPLNMRLFTRSKQKCTWKSTSKIASKLSNTLKEDRTLLSFATFKEQVNK